MMNDDLAEAGAALVARMRAEGHLDHTIRRKIEERIQQALLAHHMVRNAMGWEAYASSREVTDGMREALRLLSAGAELRRGDRMERERRKATAVTHTGRQVDMIEAGASLPLEEAAAPALPAPPVPPPPQPGSQGANDPHAAPALPAPRRRKSKAENDADDEAIAAELIRKGVMQKPTDPGVPGFVSDYRQGQDHAAAFPHLQGDGPSTKNQAARATAALKRLRERNKLSPK